MRNDKTDSSTNLSTPTSLASIDTVELENVTGGCNGSIGGCTECGPSKGWTRPDEQQ